MTDRSLDSEQMTMSAETDQTLTAATVLGGPYECIGRERVAASLGAHPALVPALEDLRARLARVFPQARFVLRHLSSPEVPSAAEDGHLLVVVSAGSMDDMAGKMDSVLRDWGSQHEAVRPYLLVAVASEVVVPYASDADALALYARLRSEDYTRYLDAARRFLSAKSGSEERALAAAELATAPRGEPGQRAEQRGGDPREVLARLRRRETAADAG
jgi:hypothetical protein